MKREDALIAIFTFHVFTFQLATNVKTGTNLLVMKFANRLERSLGRFAVPHITLYIIFLQSLTFVLMRAADARNPGHGEEFLQRLLLIGHDVYRGEVWRIFSFVMIPPVENPIFFFFSMYLLYLFGTALENHWGTFHYNVYLLIGWVASVAVALALPTMPATNAYLMESIFLAFAFLYPDFQLLLFFIFPVKVKWLALVTWIIMFVQFCMGDWLDKCLVLAAIANFLLFFHKDLWQRARGGHRRMVARAKTVRPPDEAFNRCTVCGVTEKSDPRMEFRYCGECAGTLCYCIQHIHAHAHIQKS